MCLNFTTIFHDDPTVNESEIIVFLRHVWWLVEKKEGFERRKGKEQKRKMRYSQYEN